MNRALFNQRGRGEVSSWVVFAALVAVLSLLLSVLTGSPSQAAADEVEQDADQLELVVPDEEDGTPASTGSVTVEPEPTESSTEPATEETVPMETTPEPGLAAELLEGLSPLVSAQADNGFIQINEEIVVGLGALNKTGGSAGEELRIGDTVRISGTWDAPDSPDLQPGDGFRMTLPE